MDHRPEKPQLGAGQTGELLLERLSRRREEIEQAVVARVFGPTEDLGYPDSSPRREVVRAALDYAYAALERLPEPSTEIPKELRAHARRAVKRNAQLDEMVRGYLAGASVLRDAIIGEVEGIDDPPRGLAEFLGRHADALDAVLSVVTEEYQRARAQPADTPDRQRSRLVRKLLEGDIRPSGLLHWDFEVWQVGLVGTGRSTVALFQDLAREADCRLLWVPSDTDTVWAWLGSRSKVSVDSLAKHLEDQAAVPLPVAIGEATSGPAGWRLTHLQARAAYAIAKRDPEAITRYADVALLASARRDDLLTQSLRQMYLEPLSTLRDGGHTFRATLRAYFDADRNVTATAARLGTTRRTVNTRLRTIEEKLGRQLRSIGPELELVLRLDDLDR